MFSIGKKDSCTNIAYFEFVYIRTVVSCKIECLGCDHVCSVGAHSSVRLAVLLFLDTIGSNEVIYANAVFP